MCHAANHDLLLARDFAHAIERDAINVQQIARNKGTRMRVDLSTTERDRNRSPVLQQEIRMRMSSALAFAALTAIGMAAPLTPFADPTVTAPNTINNATVDPATVPSSGIYDFEDQYKDSAGFPQPGWQYLTRPPSQPI